MVLIRLGERTPARSGRRVELGVLGLVALRRAAAAAGLPPLPDDLVVDPATSAADGSGIDLAPRDGSVEEDLSRAAELLRGAGVLDDDGRPVPAVAANLAAVVAAPRRVRVSLSGTGTSVVAHHWVDAELAGSLVRRGDRCTLSLHDARSWGEEVLRDLPPPQQDAGAATPEGFTVPLEAWPALAGLDEQPTAAADLVAGLAGTTPDVVDRVRAWAEDVRAVLHVSVPSTGSADGGAGPSYDLVRFLGRGCWWTARLGRAPDGTRTATVRATDLDEVRTALGALVAEAWSLSGSRGAGSDEEGEQ